MFGYVRPFQPELKCKDFDLYKACYCGLCRAMRRRYGLLAPFFLHYDFTFLTLLLWQPDDVRPTCRGRCYANPLRKKAMCPDSPALEAAADESVILTYWKLRDSAADDGFWGGLPARTLSLLLRRAYRRAASHRAAFDQKVRGCLAELAGLEREGCPSMDRAADTFARILQAAVPEEEAPQRKRILEQLLYHVGRWIYLVDARDDLKEDLASGSYNPLARRYGSGGDDEALQVTLEHSLNLARAAYQLGEFGRQSPLLENILYLGLPLVERAVLDGSWKEIKKQKIWRNEA